MSLSELGVSYKYCKEFATECKSRVDSLERYKQASTTTIIAQEKLITDFQTEKESKPFPWVHVSLSLLVGALTGVIFL